MAATNCGGRFTTFERVQLRDLIVVKRDGRKAVFERDKLRRSLKIALQKRPVTDDQLDHMISGIVRQLENMGENEIKTSDIGEMVMEVAERLDPVGFIRYASVYKDFKTPADFAALRRVPGRRRRRRRGGRMSGASATRPHVTLKLATSLDGRIALASGKSQWITGEAARAEVASPARRARRRHRRLRHRARGRSRTHRAHSIRRPAKQPLRIVADSRGRIPASANSSPRSTWAPSPSPRLRPPTSTPAGPPRAACSSGCCPQDEGTGSISLPDS